MNRSLHYSVKTARTKKNDSVLVLYSLCNSHHVNAQKPAGGITGHRGWT